MVVAGAALRRRDLELLFELGVDDSNHSTQNSGWSAIKSVCQTEVLFIVPLTQCPVCEDRKSQSAEAWAHAKVINSWSNDQKMSPFNGFSSTNAKGNTMARALVVWRTRSESTSGRKRVDSAVAAASSCSCGVSSWRMRYRSGMVFDCSSGRVHPHWAPLENGSSMDEASETLLNYTLPPPSR